MRIPDRERAAHRAAFRAMSLAQKAEYVFAYYKPPLVLALVAAVALGSVAHRMLTYREPVLYVAYVNVVPGDEVGARLTTGFLDRVGADPKTSEVLCYQGLYLSDEASQQDHQYAYASKLKLMAAVDAEQLDVVLMNRDAYDLLSASGYLLDLHDACADDAALLGSLGPHLVSNMVILSDNSVEVELGATDEYVAESVESANAVDVTTACTLDALSGDEPLYLGVIANTPRGDASLDYVAYVLGAGV